MKRLMLASFLLLAAAGALFASETVLIAKEDTGYKKALVEVLVGKLEADGITVVVIDHQKDNLTAVDPTEYDAVYILNSGALARVRPVVLDWLDEVRRVNNNVILHTTQITNWTPPVEVDSITSASKKSNIDEVSTDIVNRIKAKF